MSTFLSLLIAALMGWWCFNIAKKNGRETTLAAILGFLFGIFAVLGYYIAGEKKN